MSFVEDVYRTISRFPKEERYALSDQLRRSVVSIPSNIAEGFGREASKDFARFLTMARGSLYESMTQLELAVRLGYITPGEGLYEKALRISKMLTSLARKIRKGFPDDHSTKTNDH